nr:unnamed protein product [Digitaria exilis]
MSASVGGHGKAAAAETPPGPGPGGGRSRCAEEEAAASGSGSGSGSASEGPGAGTRRAPSRVSSGWVGGGGVERAREGSCRAGPHRTKQAARVSSLVCSRAHRH